MRTFNPKGIKPVNLSTFLKQTQKQEREKHSKPKQQPKRFTHLKDVYPNMELFKREHPEAFFKHKTVTDKVTGKKTAVPMLDKAGRKIPIAGPTR